MTADYEKILLDIKTRDEYDSQREVSPLKIPDGAIILDTSDMTEQQVIDKILGFVHDRGLQKIEAE